MSEGELDWRLVDFVNGGEKGAGIATSAQPGSVRGWVSLILCLLN